jgi:EAL domain-containing protein (putative c-di-GMP-specific phosphodiesterase class I)
MTSRAIKFHYAAFTPQLEISYRPIIDRRHDRLTGALALPRWSLDGMIVKPATLSAAESTEAVLRQIAEDYSGYLWACKDFSIRLELSPQTLLNQHFPEMVDSLLARYGIPAPVITFGLISGSSRRQPVGASRFNAQPLSIAALARRYFSIANEAQTVPR